MPDVSTHNEDKMLASIGLTRKNWIDNKAIVSVLKPIIEKWRVDNGCSVEFDYYSLRQLIYKMVKDAR